MEKMTLHRLQAMKDRREPIAMLTAYDYPTATLMDQAGIDVILVGDSVGMVVHGFENTLPVTMDMMVMHCQAVRRGARRALLVADMPFMSYQASVSDALRNAARLLAEGGAGLALVGRTGEAGDATHAPVRVHLAFRLLSPIGWDRPRGPAMLIHPADVGCRWHSDLRAQAGQPFRIFERRITHEDGAVDMRRRDIQQPLGAEHAGHAHDDPHGHLCARAVLAIQQRAIVVRELKHAPLHRTPKSPQL